MKEREVIPYFACGAPFGVKNRGCIRIMVLSVLNSE